MTTTEEKQSIVDIFVSAWEFIANAVAPNTSGPGFNASMVAAVGDFSDEIAIGIYRVTGDKTARFCRKVSPSFSNTLNLSYVFFYVRYAVSYRD